MTLMLGCGLGLTELKGSPQWSAYSDSHWAPPGCTSLPPTSLPQPGSGTHLPATTGLPAARLASLPAVAQLGH